MSNTANEGNCSQESPTKRRNRDESAEKLLAAALELFSEQGFDATTTRAIAQRAGLNEALIQRYFGGKEGLLAKLLGSLSCAEEQRSCDAPALATDVPSEIDAYFTFDKCYTSQQRSLLRLALAHAHISADGRTNLKNHLLENRARFLSERLNRIQCATKLCEASTHVPEDTQNAAQAVVLMGIALHLVGEQILGLTPQEIDGAKKVFIEAVSATVTRSGR